MQKIQDAPRRSTDAREFHRTLRIKQADKFEVLVAASEAEGLCLLWLADQLSEPERVSP